jgi:hypothetical protein
LEVNRDNTLYAPNYLSNAVTSTGPWEFVQNITPRETYGIRHDSGGSGTGVTDAMRDGNGDPLNNIARDGIYDEDLSYATPSDGLKLYRPAANATVAGAATGPMSHRDFLGAVRVAGRPASKGAIEPLLR